MRLHELYIDGFGHFCDQTMGPLNPAITVLYGPNETGKSTLLAFIRTILFGFRRSGRSQFYPPLAGGKHGGRITLSDDQGTTYTLERSEGPKGGPYVLRTNSGEVLADPSILQRLTGHSTLDLFSNVFAFSLEEMQSEGLMNDAELSGRLYSTGMGASALPEFIRKLDKHREALFRPQGSTQEIVVLIRKLNDVDDKLRDIQGNAEQYHRLTSRQAEISRELTEIDSEISNLNTSRTEIERLLQGWDEWVALEDCEARLRDIPKFERFPENPIERLEGLQSRIRTARNERDEADDELQRIKEAVKAPIPGEALLNDAESIEAIRRGRTRFDDSAHNLPKLQEGLRELEDTLSQRLRTLGQDWNEETLDTVDTSLAIRQRSEDWRDMLNKDAGEVGRMGIRLEESRKLLKELEDEERAAHGKLQADPTTGNSFGMRPPNGRLVELLDDQEQVEQIRRGRGSFNDSVRDLPERLAELGAQKEDVGKRLRNLGQNWDEARLENFDTSIAFRQETDGWRGTLATHTAQVRQDRERLERAKSELAGRQADVNQAQSQLPPRQPSMETSELETRRNALRTARSRLGEYTSAKNNLESLQGQLASLASNRTSGKTSSEGPPVLHAAILGLVGLVLILFGIYFGQEALILGALGGLAMLVVAAYLLFRRRVAPETAENPLTDAIAQNVRDAELATEKARRLLVEASQPLDLDDEPTAETLDNAEAELDSASSALSAWNQANLRVKDAGSALDAQQKRVDETTGQVNSAINAENESRREWQQWLAQHGLPEGSTPDTVVDFTGRIEITHEKIGEMHRMQKRVSAIEVDIEEYTKMVRALATKYRIPFENADYQRIMSVADTLIKNFDSVRQLVGQHDDVKRRLSKQEQAVTDASNEHNRAADTLQERQAEWHNWLREHGFDDGFTPESLLEFLAQAETAQMSSSETQKMRNQVSAIKVDIDEFRNQVKPLAEAPGISLDLADVAQLAAVADTLIRRLEETRTLFQKRQQDQQLKKQKEEVLQRLENTLRSVEEKLARFLEVAGADDEEDLRRRAKQYEQRLHLEAQRDKNLLGLTLLSGPDERLTAFRESLASSKRNQLTEDSRALLEQVGDTNRRRDELRDERVENGLTLNQLSSEDESSVLRIERNILMEQLQEKAREWSQLTIAGEILRLTQQKFERERQPSVIQHAEDFFGSVTGERYQRLYAPIGQQTITVIDKTGRDKSPSQLSRGTREQLYLALRFGLIREFGKHAEHLPVIVDEALVNFDSERANLATRAFAELSQTNQVLVFTCHRTIADMFANVGATVVDIGQQGTP